MVPGAQPEGKSLLVSAPFDGTPIAEVETGRGRARVVASGHVANVDGQRVPRQPPRLGEHTDTILADLGYSADEINKLRETGVV